MKFTPAETMALAIDYQERLMPVIADGDAVLERAEILLTGLQLLNIPLLITRQYPKGLGDVVPGIKNIAAGVPVLDKITFSACRDPYIIDAARDMGRKNIIVCGVETHICVLQTIMDFQAAGFQTALVADCVGSRRKSDKEIGIKRAMQEGSLITCCETLLFELLGSADNEMFKNISLLIK